MVAGHRRYKLCFCYVLSSEGRVQVDAYGRIRTWSEPLTDRDLASMYVLCPLCHMENVPELSEFRDQWRLGSSYRHRDNGGGAREIEEDFSEESRRYTTKLISD